MSQVVQISEVRLKRLVKKAFKNWFFAFKETCDETTRLNNLSYETIKKLAVCRDDMSFYIYDLIMNLLGLGSGMKVYELYGPIRLKILDIYLFILDRIRFEGMKRLGWIDSYPGEDIPIVELVLRYEELRSEMERIAPTLSKDHQAYEQYSSASEYDREGIVRRLIPQMIKDFERKE